ncbi:hypothetical protein PUR61_32235 [Streptomyces sp. BE20]|uniref:hypothetical protein n=1 Tax=unclassified Streptomyces TaxID=2593676 RepID=UPI002E75D6D4|nr:MULTISPECIES: hypothetical protein [unclassified Streptomyces]MED7949030.1 hypothetical protein [Streptomyces sp. BE303]MEE1826820.1 hypothetical protein [Streptomyces sp. BE20]
MIVTLILAAEVAFWVVLGLALTARYVLRLRTVSTALLIGLPVLDLALFTLAVLDLRGGATASWTHALAASYAGFSLGFGPSLVRWADRHFQYRFAGGPKPARPPKYGPARTRYEWQVAGRTTVSAGVTLGLITLMVPLSAGAAAFSTFTAWYLRLSMVAGINLIVAACYAIWPKEPPAGAIVEDGHVVGWEIPRQHQQL